MIVGMVHPRQQVQPGQYMQAGRAGAKKDEGGEDGDDHAATFGVGDAPSGSLFQADVGGVVCMILSPVEAPGEAAHPLSQISR
jgi:hypothetical protein